MFSIDRFQPRPQSMTTEQQINPLSYKSAGVDIDAGNAFVERIKHLAKRTHRPEVMGGLGGFGALCELPQGYREPVLVSGTDGVGTKLRLALDAGIHNTIGIDLVAMCVNDLVVCGAEPLLFLDYYATGALNIDTATAVVEGISKGCELAGCALVGGETAEMPGMYKRKDYDLAGFCTGVVEKSKIIDGTRVHVDDKLIGLASSGPHSNGYSLIRKIIKLAGVDINEERINRQPLIKLLMEPTRIYVKPLLHLIRNSEVHALSHITGGGLLENIPRVLPDNTKAIIDTTSWKRPAVFNWLQKKGNIKKREMYRTFNCGVGMVLVVPAAETSNTIDILHASGENAFVIGDIAHANTGEEQVELKGIPV